MSKARLFALAGMAAGMALAAAPAGLAAPTVTPLPISVIVAGPASFATTFVTPEVVVPAGTRVTFANLDVAPHNVTPDDPLANWGSPSTATGTVPVSGVEYLPAGTYGFHCSIHLNMTGTLTVV